MNTDTILATLASAAGFLKEPIQGMMTQAMTDAYGAIAGYLRSKLAGRPDALDALSQLEQKPESDARRCVLAEEAPDLESDTHLVRLAKDLAALLPVGGGKTQRVSVRGNRNNVHVAGRDIITTAKHVRRNEITPDERHITGEQKAQLRKVNNELALRLAGEDGRPDYGAGYVALEKHFGVSSYLLIPREKFDEALSLLKQRRAMNRSKLRRRDPTAYSRDFYRAIYARANELGWERPQVYEFAFKNLSLKKPIASLKALGANQLKALAESIRRVEK